MIAGPVLFAMADMASYALTLVLRQAEDALTANLLINLFRLALDLRLLGEAVSLRAGRPLLTNDIPIWPEATGRDRLLAQVTVNWSTPALADSSAAGRRRGHHAC
jgi:acyl-coenzyme A thioesterase PaaI-like protein